jgi:hypothetical protein
MTLRRPSPKNPAVLKHQDHQRLWRMVEGAVVDALRSHPEYLTARGERSAVASITKRVVGNLTGHAKQTLAGGRLDGCTAPTSFHGDVGAEVGLSPISQGPGCASPAPTGGGQ